MAMAKRILPGGLFHETHTDAYETACRAAKLLARSLASGIRPRTVLRHPPIIWAPPGTGTADEPMRTLTAMAADAEADHNGIWAVNVTAGFSFADTPDTGLAVTVVGDGPEATLASTAETIARKAWETRHRGEVLYPRINDVLREILPVTEGPILLVEPSDNIGGGAPGDGTGVLRALLQHRVPDSLVIINDPESVGLAQAVPIGASLKLALGGKSFAGDPGPVSLEVTVVSRSDGRFELEDANSHLASMVGRRVDMGDCAVVRHEGLTILLTSRKTPPFDLGQLRSQGIEPARMKVIGVKAAVAHQRAYDPIARASFFVDTPGPCSSRLADFTYRHLSRPVFPLDAEAAFDIRLRYNINEREQSARPRCFAFRKACSGILLSSYEIHAPPFLTVRGCVGNARVRRSVRSQAQHPLYRRRRPARLARLLSASSAGPHAELRPARRARRRFHSRLLRGASVQSVTRCADVGPPSINHGRLQ